MSKDAAIALAERLKTDEALQTRLAGAADPSERLAIVREEGFDLSRDDAAAVKQALGVEELSDEDLARVAGGGSTTTIVTASATVEGTMIVTIVASAFI
jgi:predicted ribosomally synthesized peptide with nif11-like leader